MRLDWSALVINKCPKCGEELEEDKYHCFCLNCDFKIAKTRAEVIVKNMEEQEID